MILIFVCRSNLYFDPIYCNNAITSVIFSLASSEFAFSIASAISPDPNLSEMHKSIMLRQISGTCMVCGKIPLQIAKYRMYEATVIEKYSDEYLARMHT
jgi:hypothetical protein